MGPHINDLIYQSHTNQNILHLFDKKFFLSDIVPLFTFWS